MVCYFTKIVHWKHHGRNYSAILIQILTSVSRVGNKFVNPLLLLSVRQLGGVGGRRVERRSRPAGLGHRVDSLFWNISAPSLFLETKKHQLSVIRVM